MSDIYEGSGKRNALRLLQEFENGYSFSIRLWKKLQLFQFQTVDNYSQKNKT